MNPIPRRRFLTITAAAAAAAAALPARAEDLSVWRGAAIGSAATIAIAGPDGEAHLAAARAEITRLERVFSLYDAGSELSRLNRDGALAAPSPDLVECLSLAAQIHSASDGLFDPTVQPLWAAYATSYASGQAPSAAELDHARGLVGWNGVSFAADGITLRSGAALTLNGIAQGFIADRVAELLLARGLSNVFVDTGEMRGLGHRPGGEDWVATLPQGGHAPLRNRALATSAPLGTTFDGAAAGHILNPRTGKPAPARWSSVSVAAGRAAVADGLSTAACLMEDEGTIRAAVARFEAAELVQAVAG